MDTKLSSVDETLSFLKVFCHFLLITSIRIVLFFRFLIDLVFIMDEMTF